MKQNEQGEIIDPSVGDAELVRMEFDPLGFNLHIKLALGKDILVLRVLNPRWMSFSTDCAQNVIEKIIVTNDLKEVAALAPQHIREMLWMRSQTIPGQIDTAKPLQALFVMPLAGPTMTCIADDVIPMRAVEPPQQGSP
jgi:hypothetical protein